EENLIRLLTRLIFVWFLKEKGLIPEEIFDPAFLEGVVKDFGKDCNYYNVILQNLFFTTLNTYPEERSSEALRYKSEMLSENEIINVFKKVPFINGGLFECLDEDENYIDGFTRNSYKIARLPDFLFFREKRKENLSKFYGYEKEVEVRGLINILKDYNFNADESSPVDVEVSLNPELLGYIFENLIASYNPETKTTARKATGSYYTPKEIVDFMVEESLLEYLKTKTSIDEDRLRILLSYSEENAELTDEEKDKILRAIDSLKVIDPAVGSGAFPIGIVHKVVNILNKVDPNNELWHELQRKKVLQEFEEVLKIEDKDKRQKLLKDIDDNFDESIKYPDYARKLYVIENSIYGVDIQPIAIQI
ncbi:MAG: BREX-1 system adenine-specific DNA-methyltransferase PglX, partial [Brevinematales bacterium]|nr:BREX-1 system adenine-specific DNA-methyltransferase PglX [Brevinematales bacterium]